MKVRRMEEEKDENRNRKRKNPREDSAATAARSFPSCRCVISASTVIFASLHRHPTAGENMIYRGQHHKQQHSLTNTQWQPRPHADTLLHHKSREVAGRGEKRGSEWEREREGRTESVADRERCRRRQEVMGERWRRISKCFLKYKQPPANVVVILLASLSHSLSLSLSGRCTGCIRFSYKQWLMMMMSGG